LRAAFSRHVKGMSPRFSHEACISLIFNDFTACHLSCRKRWRITMQKAAFHNMKHRLLHGIGSPMPQKDIT
jgi:hypothetical protein